MPEIKLTIDGTEYEMTEYEPIHKSNNLPLLYFNGRCFLGYQPKEVKPDYEIRSFISTQTEVRFKLQRNKNGTFGIYDTTEKELLASSVHAINSVLRLSDGEVFTVGDYMTYDSIRVSSWSDVSGNGCLITKFTLYEGYVYVNDHQLHKRDKSIKDWVKVKPKVPLFTTEDEITVFNESDIIFLVNSSFEVWETNAASCRKSPSVKYFYKIENRNEYIFKNKPVQNLSLKELEHVLSEGEHIFPGYHESILRKIKELFKSKM